MSNKSFRERINDYTDTIFAIIGFINLFRFDDDTRRMREDVKVFQGRIMRTSSSNKISPNNEVTPDFCIQGSNNKGIVGEVKKSFPENRDFWMDDFKQLISYDDDLLNWLTDTGKIDDHEIVLLPEQSRSRAVKRYFEERKDGEIVFTKNFVIVEFNRNNQADAYFFFRKEYGSFKYFNLIDHRLDEGIQVPILKLMPIYEKIKLYDSKPPLPYLLLLIWENVIMLHASNDERFGSLRKNSKLPVDITIDEIVQELHENYSFKKLNANNMSHQPKIPLKSWIKESVNALMSFKLAEWKNESAGKCVVYFKKFKDTLETFKDLCDEHKLDMETDEKQMELFDKKKE